MIIDSRLKNRIFNFAIENGRRPRILLAGVKDSKETRDIRVMALGFADAGFDVDISPQGMTLKSIARMAVENDVHGVGLLHVCQDLNHVAALVEFLEQEGAGDIVVITDAEDPCDQKLNRTDRVGRFVKNTLIRMGG